MFAQGYNDYGCTAITVEDGVRFSQMGGLYKPSQHTNGEYLKVLIVFAEFSNDTRTFSDWQYGQLPTYSNSLINSTVQSPYTPMSLSDYWDEMSMGNLDFIGDVYPTVVRLRPESYYSSNFLDFEDCNYDVLDSIDENVDFRNYDNWQLNPSTDVFEFSKDNIADMIYIIYRNPVNSNGWFTGGLNFGGVAELGNNMTYVSDEGVTINGNGLNSDASGITINRGAGVYYPDFLALLCHEFGHYFFGGMHTMMSGLMPGYPNSYRGGTFALSGWEREKLGYSAYVVPTQDNFTVTLGDMITTGQVLKVPVPGQANTFYVVENHQRQSIYDQVQRGGNVQGAFDITLLDGKGIYIWLIQNGESYEPLIDIKTANGNWDWSLAGTINMPAGWPAIMPLSGRTGVNRNNGKSDRYPANIYYSPNLWEKWHDTIPLTKTLSLTRNVMGLPTHPFNLEYTKLFTPWSSPSTYVNNYNTNIAIQIFSQNGNNITLKVYNTETSCLALAPSKPQNLKVTRNANYEPVLTWEPNIEPDVKSGGKYRIYSALTTGAEPTTYTFRAEINAYVNKSAIKTWTDVNNTSNGGNYKLFYKISAVDALLNESVKSDYDWVSHGDMVKSNHSNNVLPTENCLLPNYPNPFNPSTTVNYTLKETGLVEIKVYDMLGRVVSELINEIKEPGDYSVVFDARDLPSGIYFCNMKTNGYNSVQKMILQK